MANEEASRCGSERPQENNRAAPDAAGMIDRIRNGEAKAIEDLRHRFDRGVRFLLIRKLRPADVERILANIFGEITAAIERGEISEEARLPAHVRAAVQSSLASGTSKKNLAGSTASSYAGFCAKPRYIANELLSARCVPDAGTFDCALPFANGVRAGGRSEADSKAQRKDMLKILAALSGRDRQALVRYYVHQQPAVQVCRDLGLAESEFQCLRASVRARFARGGGKLTVPGPLGDFGLIVPNQTAAADHCSKR